MTAKEMRERIRATGCSVRVTDGEIRVNLRGGSEATAYYTNDREDACGTAADMARRAK